MVLAAAMKNERHDRRPYFRTADSTWREPWDNNTLALATRLSAYMHERWRTERINDPEEASRIVIPHGVLCALAGTHEMRTARARYAALCAHVSLKLTAFDAHRMQIIWPKWSEFQGLDGLFYGRSAAKPRQSASSVQRPSNKSKNKTQETRAKRAAVACPEHLEPSEWQAVGAWTAKNHPALLYSLPSIWDEVRAWAESKNIERPGWAATLRTFVMRRAKEIADESKRPNAGNGRRLTAVEAGQRIIDRLGPPREDTYVRETIHVVPIRG